MMVDYEMVDLEYQQCYMSKDPNIERDKERSDWKFFLLKKKHFHTGLAGK